MEGAILVEISFRHVNSVVGGTSYCNSLAIGQERCEHYQSLCNYAGRDIFRCLVRRFVEEKKLGPGAPFKRSFGLSGVVHSPIPDGDRHLGAPFNVLFVEWGR